VGARDRVVVVGRDLDEAERRVELARGLHVVERVEQHRRVAGAARLVEQRLGERAPEAEAAKGRPHVEALHLAGIAVLGVGERPERAAAGELAVDIGEHQVAARRGVLARQGGELGVEVLEAQIDVEARGVLAKDLDRAGKLRGRARPAQLDPGRLHASSRRHTRHRRSPSTLPDTGQYPQSKAIGRCRRTAAN
jgi:hypothetical protein